MNNKYNTKYHNTNKDVNAKEYLMVIKDLISKWMLYNCIIKKLTDSILNLIFLPKLSVLETFIPLNVLLIINLNISLHSNHYGR